MAQEILVKDVLDDKMIEAGADLTRRLDEAGVAPSASLWLYVPELNIWRLMIASPLVKSQGPRKVYRKIQSLLTGPTGGESLIPLPSITVVENNHPLISALRSAVATRKPICGIRFSRNTIRGHFVEDAYIYRMKERHPAEPKTRVHRKPTPSHRHR